jgi:hypothetical protein
LAQGDRRGFLRPRGHDSLRGRRENVDLQAGGYARVPPGVVHRFSNPTDKPSRFLGLAIPGGLDKYLEELAELMANEPSWPPADMGPVMALMANYDTFPPPTAKP